MSYSTTWYHLDKNNNIVEGYKGQACFSPITNTASFHKDTKYLLYDFSNMKVTQEEARKYFLFLKSIPEFTELMPPSCTAMAKTMQYKVDLHKFNGTKIFTILTLIRAVVEDPKIVKEVITFSRKFKYSISNFSILKLCGSVHMSNSGHWITMEVDKGNLDKMFNTRIYWDDLTQCIQTGLGKNIHNTFKFGNEGFATKNPVTRKDIEKVRDEKDKPKKVVRQKMYDNMYLQLGF